MKLAAIKDKKIIFALAWPFVAWLLFALVGVNFPLDGETYKPHIIGGINCGFYGDRIMLGFQVIPGLVAMLLVKTDFLARIIFATFYGVGAVVFYVVFFVFGTMGWLPGISMDIFI